MLRPALLLAALLLTLGAPLASASVEATDPVEVRDCHSSYTSFQVFVNDKAVTRCFVVCCDGPAEAQASAGPGPEVRPCPGGHYVVWDPYFMTTCLPLPVGGPEVEPCPGGVRVVWEPYFETSCLGLQGGPEVRPCPGGHYVVWNPYFMTTCLPA